MLEIILIVISVTIFKIITIKIYIALTLSFRIDNGQMLVCQPKPDIYDNSNVCCISHHLRDIRIKWEKFVLENWGEGQEGKNET